MLFIHMYVYFLCICVREYKFMYICIYIHTYIHMRFKSDSSVFQCFVICRFNFVLSIGYRMKIWQLSPPLYISSRYTWIMCFLYAYIYTHTLRSVWIIFLLCTYAIACNSWNETSRMLSVLKGLPFCLSTSLKWSPSSSNDMHLCKHTHTRTYIHKHKPKKTLKHTRTRTNTHTCILERTNPSWCQIFGHSTYTIHTQTQTLASILTQIQTKTLTHMTTQIQNGTWFIHARIYTHIQDASY